MREFWRRNKLLLQLLIAAAAFLGMNSWMSVQDAVGWLVHGFGWSTTIFSRLWWAQSLWGVPYARIFLALLFAGVAFNAVFTLRFRNRPVSVLRTEITLKFENAGAICTSHRRQWIRANRPGVTAYYLKTTLSEPGATFGSELRVWASSPDGIKVKADVSGNSQSRAIDLCYEQPMPYAWYTPLFPRWLLTLDDSSRLPLFIRNKIVQQHVSYVANGEYSGAQPRFGAHSTRYHHHRLSIVVDFSLDAARRPSDEAGIRIVRRLANALVTEHALPADDGRKHVYQIAISTGIARDEEISITW